MMKFCMSNVKLCNTCLSKLLKPWASVKGLLPRHHCAVPCAPKTPEGLRLSYPLRRSNMHIASQYRCSCVWCMRTGKAPFVTIVPTAGHAYFPISCSGAGM